MNNLSFDIASEVLWKYLPIDQILQYCRTNRAFASICNNPDTWRFLLMRDYNQTSVTNNPRAEYILEHNIETETARINALTPAAFLAEYNTLSREKQNEVDQARQPANMAALNQLAIQDPSMTIAEHARTSAYRQGADARKRIGYIAVISRDMRKRLMQ